jgi:hypothetical protein
MLKKPKVSLHITGTLHVISEKTNESIIITEATNYIWLHNAKGNFSEF